MLPFPLSMFDNVSVLRVVIRNMGSRSMLSTDSFPYDLIAFTVGSEDCGFI